MHYFNTLEFPIEIFRNIIQFQGSHFIHLVMAALGSLLIISILSKFIFHLSTIRVPSLTPQQFLLKTQFLFPYNLTCEPKTILSLPKTQLPLPSIMLLQLMADCLDKSSRYTQHTLTLQYSTMLSQRFYLILKQRSNLFNRFSTYHIRTGLIGKCQRKISSEIVITGPNDIKTKRKQRLRSSPMNLLEIEILAIYQQTTFRKVAPPTLSFILPNHIIQTIMLLERSPSESIEEHTHLNQELKDYKKANYSLRKKLKEKQAKIHQLFGYIQDASRGLPQSPEPTLVRSQMPYEKHPKLTLSDNRRKEKENKNIDHEDSNIFKHPSIPWINRANREEVRLPALQRKAKNIFSPEELLENPERKSKIVRIPLDRLKPIDSEQVRKRFLLKYSRVDNQTQ